MKEVWTEDPKKIRAELKDLISGQISLTFFQPGQPPRKISAAEIDQADGENLLLLRKTEPFRAPQNNALVLYHPQGQPMRGFQVVPVLETNTQLSILIPSAIIQVQRRRCQRFLTSARSTVTFTRRGSRYITNGKIKDVCLEGAGLIGDFSDHIKAGDVLSPVTIKLRLDFGVYEEIITAPEAAVKRVLPLKGGDKELGVHFLLTGQEHERLERFLSLRSLEAEGLVKPRKTGK